MEYGLFSLSENLNYYLGKVPGGADGFHGTVSDSQSSSVSAKEAPVLIAPALKEAGVRLYPPCSRLPSTWECSSQLGIPRYYFSYECAKTLRGRRFFSRQLFFYDVAHQLTRKLGFEKIICARNRGYGGRALRAIPFGWRKQIELRTDAPELQSLVKTYRDVLQCMSTYGTAYGNVSKNDLTE